MQFAGGRSVRFRIISVDPRVTYAGWVWLVGYVVGAGGEADERREVFVQRAGLLRRSVGELLARRRVSVPVGWPSIRRVSLAGLMLMVSTTRCSAFE
ncbi:hypothetical protein BG844_18660 [Couchioplanes caeruleus subsp. caeruleus]|uniref:Uncharacterized protein n=1 Tax=Couchioplanes caeruleus subsp. caeruleus TaxID=56427 RepID=A0A1K0FIW7_9ACTN|nr:hypothetical protein BG844_18660 [Couchioplanes caeruleus subsp. caeruleus]